MDFSNMEGNGEGGLKPKGYSSKPLLGQSWFRRLKRVLGSGLVTGSRVKSRETSWPGTAEDKRSFCRTQGVVRLVTIIVPHFHSQQMALRPNSEHNPGSGAGISWLDGRRQQQIYWLVQQGQKSMNTPHGL